MKGKVRKSGDIILSRVARETEIAAVTDFTSTRMEKNGQFMFCVYLCLLFPHPLYETPEAK